MLENSGISRRFAFVQKLMFSLFTLFYYVLQNILCNFVTVEELTDLRCYKQIYITGRQIILTIVYLFLYDLKLKKDRIQNRGRTKWSFK